MNLLRVHNPGKSGDLINRFTTLEAERTGQTAWGIELGPLGTFTLRVVRPVFDGDTLIGYLELGKEIEDILEDISEEYHLELAAVIHKDALKRQKWESGMKMLGREADWNHFANDVIIYSSLGHLPDEAARFVGETGHTHEGEITGAEFNGKSWQIMTHPLIDASGTGVGDLIIRHDISKAKAAFHQLLITSSGAALVLLTGLLGFLYVLLLRTDRGICLQQMELQTNEEKIRSILETVPDYIINLDRNGIITFINRAVPGSTVKGIIGTSIYNHIPPDYHDKYQNALEEVLTEGKTVELETFISPAGSEITMWNLNRIGPMTANEQIIGDVIASTDIAERKQAEQELENIAKFPSENPNPVLRITKDGEVLYSNQAGELLLTKWKSGIGKTVPEKWRNTIANTFTSGKSIKEEKVKGRIFSVTIAPIKEAGYVNLYASDITESKQSEEQLRKNEHQYRTLVENLPQRILLKDRDSIFISCNESYAKEFDMTPAEMVGKTDHDFYKKQSADKYRASDCEVMKTRERKDDYITLTEDDKEKIIHVVKTPVIDNESEDGDELVGVLCIFEDVTRQKQAERSAEKAYGELHEAHEELKGVQSQIIQNEKLASIGQLAAGVAHEINNPMGFVSSNFETLQSYVKKFQRLFDIYSEFVEEAKSEGGKKMLEKVEEIEELREDTQIDFVIEDIGGLFSDMQEGLGRITNIVQNLRDFSRIDQRGELAEYDLNDGIRSTLLVAKNEIKYDANVKTDFGEVPLFLCNPGQVNQVFLNILMNAAQAIKSLEKKKKGNITVSTYVDDEDAVCEITDDGPGIAPDKVSKIFDPFFTTKAPGKGTGLGLSVSHDIIVNKHNGVILVDSTVGESTKFTIRLPIKCDITEGTDEI